MKRMILSFFLFSMLCSFPIAAQDNKPIIRFIPFVIEGLGQEEAQFISTLIQSYVTDIGDMVQVYEAEDATYSLSAQETSLQTDMGPGPDFILSGSITVDQETRILSLKIIKNLTGETVYHTSIYKTTTDLTLKVRSLVEAAFSMGFDGMFHEEVSQEILTESRILGTWRGDAGVELIRLQRGGTGLAILSSGVQMNLTYSIENNSLRITQTSPNSEWFYHPMPFDVASILKARAEPWRYELFLYDNGTVLRGLKTFTGVRYEANRVVELFPGSIQEAEWTKSR
ncbi:hypothetical protein LQZ19_14980 [Treponema primitia]|uniref:TP0183 family DNA metabolism protein n=1 Tax=Treponema primitia TaxID=88058 RepID=UPI00398171EB